MHPQLESTPNQEPRRIKNSISLHLGQLMLMVFAIAALVLLFMMVSIGTVASADNYCASAWDASSVYATPMQVSHNGNNWRNQWWSQNEEPSVNSNWVDEGACTSTPTPTPTLGSNVTPTPQPTPNPNADKVRIFYFPEWGVYGRDYFVDDIEPRVQAGQVTHIQYGFINVDASGNCQLFDSWAANEKPGRGNYQQLGALRQLAALRDNNPGLKIVLSLGGWTLSNHFSDVVADSNKLATMVSSCVGMMQAYDFDGLDIDWEYPGVGGLGNSFDEVNDGPNYVTMMQALRAGLDAAESGGRDYLLTAAVATGEDKFYLLPMGDAIQHMDYMSVMTYDMNGAWQQMPAHNAPLFRNPNDPNPMTTSLGTYSVEHAIDMYMNGGTTANGETVQGGVPASKLVLGIPFYGRSWVNVPNTARIPGMPGLFGTSDNGALTTTGGACNCEPNYTNMPNPMWDGSTSPGTLVDAVGNASGGSWEESVFDYDDINARLLTTGGYTRYWDADSLVPFAYNPHATGGTFVSYADEESVCYKAKYSAFRDLAGVMVWDMSQNSEGGNDDLYAAIGTGLSGGGSLCNEVSFDPSSPTMVTMQQAAGVTHSSDDGVLAVLVVAALVIAVQLISQRQNR